MTYQALSQFIFQQKSYLCVGLDSDIHKLPAHLLHTANPLLEFNKAIIEATSDYCVAYKINTAFYEAFGAKGWQILEDTLHLIPKTHFVIADAKRGDIGNTADRYAQAFFKQMNFDALTVAPYMGADSVKPFLAYQDKWTILLALTSNEGNADFQLLDLNGKKLYEHVLLTAQKWADHQQMMFVVGATQAQFLTSIRQIAPLHFLLVPGVGAQGGSLEEVSRYGMNQACGLLVNASRSILYASSGEDFAEKAASEAQKMQKEMEIYLYEKNKI